MLAGYRKTGAKFRGSEIMDTVKVASGLILLALATWAIMAQSNPIAYLGGAILIILGLLLLIEGAKKK